MAVSGLLRGVLLGDGFENNSGLRRCTASSGDLSGAAQDYEDAMHGISFDSPSGGSTCAREAPREIKRKTQPKHNNNVWESVFNPGRNMGMRGKVGASMFDRPTEERATSVWDEILKAEAVRNLSFADVRRTHPLTPLTLSPPVPPSPPPPGESGHPPGPRSLRCTDTGPDAAPPPHPSPPPLLPSRPCARARSSTGTGTATSPPRSCAQCSAPAPE